MEKILFIKANPIDSENLRLEQEEKRIREALSRSQSQKKFDFQTRGAVTKENLLDYLFEIKPNILHISGHGDSENSLFLEDKEGYKEEISIEKFSKFLGNFLDHINCVFLNACHSLAEINGLNKDIPNLIGMRKEIGDQVAIDFSSSFYTSLFNGKSVKESFKIALDIISLTSFDDELIPKLIESPKAQKIQEETKETAIVDKRPSNPSGEIEKKLVSNEEIEMVKRQKEKKVRFYKMVILFAFIIAITSSAALYMLNESLFATVISAVLPAALGLLPIVEIRKGTKSIELMDLYKLKRKRLLTAISNITPEDIKNFNDEFYLRITL